MDWSLDEIDLDFDHLVEHVDPIKSPRKAPHKELQSLVDHKWLENIPRLEPQNDLFEATSKYKNYNIFNDDDRLRTNKIEKLIRDLEQDEQDLEMDNQGRSRIFQGRLRGLDYEEEVDERIMNYLSDKENLLDPVKISSPSIRKGNNKIKKPLKPLKGGNSLSIPVLKPQGANYKFQPHQDTSKGPCRPNHRTLKESKPSLVYRQNASPLIFLVDSLTGSLNDATQFGTELNASNCEGFPLPENVHEVVQIPTNDETTTKSPKLAIIKTFHNKYFAPKRLPSTRTGFYSKQEFLNYIENLNFTTTDGIEVVSEPSTQLPKKRSKAVRFADDLEW